MTTYQELIDHIASNRLDQNTYYNLLLTHSSLIIDKCISGKKQTVAKDLGMTSQAFSSAYKFMVAYNAR